MLILSDLMNVKVWGLDAVADFETKNRNLED
jgi:hypothetical protein